MASALRHGLSAAPLLRLGLSQPTTTMATTTTTTSHTPSLSLALLRAPIPTPARLFSTTAPAQRKPVRAYPRQGHPRDSLGTSVPIPSPNAVDAHIPPYPYGPRRVFKQSNTGLYGSARIQFGHNVSEKHGVKTPRVWRLNVHRRRLWSRALRCFIQTRVTNRVLRTIDKCGGIDEYLLGEKAQRIKDLGPWGWKLRWRVMQSDVVQERYSRQRLMMGLVPPHEEVDVDPNMAEWRADVGHRIPAPLDQHAKREAMAEIDRLIRGEHDFPLGEEEPEAPNDEGFMKEKEA